MAPDAKNPEEYVLYLGQGGLGLPDESYYREERHAAILAAYLPHVARMLAFAGIGEGSTDDDSPAARVVALETRLAGHHWDNVATRDAVKSYNPYGYYDLEELAPNVMWGDFVRGLEAREAFEHVVVGQPSYLEGLSVALDEVIIDDFKYWLAFHVVASAAPLLSKELVDAEFDFTGRVISGLPENRERWKRGVSLVEGAIGEAVGQLYAAEYFPPAAKERMLELVGNLVEAFRRSFEGLRLDGSADPRAGAGQARLVHPQGRLPGPLAGLLLADHRRRPRRQRRAGPTRSSCSGSWPSSAARSTATSG